MGSFIEADSPGSKASKGSDQPAPKLPKLARNGTDISQRKEAIHKTEEGAFPAFPGDKVECRTKGCKTLITVTYRERPYCPKCPKCPKCKTTLKRASKTYKKLERGDLACPAKGCKYIQKIQTFGSDNENF